MTKTYMVAMGLVFFTVSALITLAQAWLLMLLVGYVTTSYFGFEGPGFLTALAFVGVVNVFGLALGKAAGKS